MNHYNRVAEQRITAHESRMKHIDELMQHSELIGDTERKAELTELKEKQAEMGDYIEKLKTRSPEQLMETAGPMVMWELVAQRLEKLVEKIKQ